MAVIFEYMYITNICGLCMDVYCKIIIYCTKIIHTVFTLLHYINLYRYKYVL